MTNICKCILSTLFFLNISLAQLVASDSTEDKLAIPKTIVPVLPFTKEVPINRGYVKNTVTNQVEQKNTSKSSSKVKGKGKGKGKETDTVDNTQTITTTSYTFHLMAKGHRSKPVCSCVSGSDKTCYGVASLTPSTLNPKNNIWEDSDKGEMLEFINMPANDHYIGHTFFKDLAPSSSYNLKIGFIKGHAPISLNDVQFDWSNVTSSYITIPAAKPADTCSFIYGSCNRIGKVLGVTLWEDNGSQVLLQAAQNVSSFLISDKIPTTGFVFLGDWIYNDATGEWNAATNFEDIMGNYKTANSTTGAKAIFKKMIPVHQMEDDHEVKNNSSADDENSKRHKDAKKAYGLNQRPQGDNTPENWYTIDDTLDAFMMNLRAENYPSRNQTISDEQMNALKAWLIDPVRKDRIKPIFMSTTCLMFAGDGWGVSPNQHAELLNFIKTNDILYVAIFAGDLHFGVNGIWEFDDDISDKKILKEDKKEGKKNDTEKPSDISTKSSKTKKIEITLKDEKDEVKTRLRIFEGVSSAIHSVGTPGKINKVSDKLDLSAHGGPKMSAIGGLSHSIIENHFTRIVLDHNNKSIRSIKIDKHGNTLLDAIYDFTDGSTKATTNTLTTYSAVNVNSGGDSL